MSDHNQDEYLDPSEYLKHPADDAGFNKFEDNGSYYFSKLDGDQVIFMSQGYTSEAGRDNGIESVKKNMVLSERYVAEEYDGRWYLSLKAGNRQEIAVSPLFATKAEVEAMIPGGGGSSASTGTSGVAASSGSAGGTVSSGASSSGKRASTDGSSKIAPLVAGSGILVGFLGKTEIADSSSSITKVKDTKTRYYTDDSYLPMSKYNDNIANKSTIDGDFIQFSEGGKFYWGLLDSEGKMAIRSEGYSSAADRDGSVAEVSKGKWQGSNYSILETREGKYYVLLKDGSHNEIGRSVAFSSRAEAVGFVPETSVTYQTIASGGGAKWEMGSKAAAAMAAASQSSFVAKAGGAAATAAATTFKAAPVIAPIATKAAAAAGWGLVPWAAGLLLLPLLFLLKPVPSLVPLAPVIAKVVPPPPPVIPPPIPPPPAKVQLVGPKVGPKVSGF